MKRVSIYERKERFLAACSGEIKSQHGTRSSALAVELFPASPAWQLDWKCIHLRITEVLGVLDALVTLPFFDRVVSENCDGKCGVCEDDCHDVMLSIFVSVRKASVFRSYSLLNKHHANGY